MSSYGFEGALMASEIEKASDLADAAASGYRRCPQRDRQHVQPIGWVAGWLGGWVAGWINTYTQYTCAYVHIYIYICIHIFMYTCVDREGERERERDSEIVRARGRQIM